MSVEPDSPDLTPTPFAVFEVSSGNLVRRGVCAAWTVDSQAVAGEEVAVAGEFDHHLNWWDGDAVQEYPAAAIEAKAAPPAWPAAWSNAAMTWVDQRSLDQVKADAKEALKARRNELEFAPFTYAGHVFDGDREAWRRLTGAISIAKSVLAAGGAWSQDWVLHDNASTLLQAADFVQIELLLAQRTSALIMSYAGLRAAVDAATTAAEVAAVRWPEA